ncbi:hypothetical protein F1D05_32650 [Kribbella qitaiheensis]|uniref:WD40 repeat domain-containing protein n=1 Tax=Kribbella qitaiheensis TaxID=1544730 RepID=A0A7G6X6D7_9ACTN|nr:hypothetical protein [Kribbella qitaiheensis]QNE21802.1 hypothetical protein F1D05_32650 [Kribbella qitaiheensis]
MPNRVRRGALAAVALLTATLIVSACNNSDPTTDGLRQGDPVAWTKVGLPAGEEPVTLTPKGEELLIGLRHRGAKVVPGLTIQSADGKLTPIPLKPSSAYAFEAIWQSVAIEGTTILGLAGAAGGAHSNTRYTVWTGSTAGLVEKPQEFNTFGGQTAGSVIGAALTPAGGALLGTWGSEVSGLDAAVWLPQGEKWIRQKVAGTALQSTANLLVGPSSSAVSGSGIVFAGSQVKLGPNLVEQHAVLWRSIQLNQGWSRFELPDAGNRSEARTISCTATVCLASGYVDGKLAIWKVEGDKASRYQGVPQFAVGDKDQVPSAVESDGKLIQVAADGGKVKVLTGDGSQWTVRDATGPSGQVTQTVQVGSALYLLSGPVGGPLTLWKTDLTALH